MAWSLSLEFLSMLLLLLLLLVSYTGLPIVSCPKCQLSLTHEYCIYTLLLLLLLHHTPVHQVLTQPVVTTITSIIPTHHQRYSSTSSLPSSFAHTSVESIRRRRRALFYTQRCYTADTEPKSTELLLQKDQGALSKIQEIYTNATIDSSS